MILLCVTWSTKVMLQVLSVSCPCIDISIQYMMAATSALHNYTFCPCLVSCDFDRNQATAWWRQRCRLKQEATPTQASSRPCPPCHGASVTASRGFSLWPCLVSQVWSSSVTSCGLFVALWSVKTACSQCHSFFLSLPLIMRPTHIFCTYYVFVHWCCQFELGWLSSVVLHLSKDTNQTLPPQHINNPHIAASTL